MIFLNNKKVRAQIISSVFLLSILLMPAMMLADNNYLPIIRCGEDVSVAGGKLVGSCDFNDVVDTLNRIVLWIISMAGVVFTIMAIWGGFLYMTSGDNPGNKTKARSVLLNTMWGLIIMLVAWVVVVTILKALVFNPSSNSIFNFIRK